MSLSTLFKQLQGKTSYHQLSMPDPSMEGGVSVSLLGNHPAKAGKTKLGSSGNFLLKTNEKRNPKISASVSVYVGKQKKSRGKTREKLILPLEFSFKRSNGLLFNAFP